MAARSTANLTSAELSDLSLPAAFFQDTTEWRGTRVIEQLSDFLESLAKSPDELKAAPKENGTPHTLIVTASALRAANIVRATKKFAGDESIVAKLFAKHVKVEEQEEMLKKSRVSVGVGTPARVLQLIQHGALSLDSLERLVVDASHIDQKKMGIMEIKDTMAALARLLTLDQLKSRYEQDGRPLSLVFF